MPRIFLFLMLFFILFPLSIFAAEDFAGTVKNVQGTVAVKRQDKVSPAERGRGFMSTQIVPPMSQERITTTFGEALASEPLQPLNFLLCLHLDSLALTSSSSRLIQPILDAIAKRQSRDISIIGHSDRAGSQKHNFVLSTRRAQFISAMLVEKGVDPAIIQVSSHGEGNPRVPTDDNVQEPQNRRVEVIVR